MRKIVGQGTIDATPAADGAWLDLEAAADVRLDSEAPGRPIEAALQPDAETWWEAAKPGRQTIRLSFHEPRTVAEIHLRFEVRETRTQEFVLQWSGDRGTTWQPVLRQQFNFARDGATVEEEHLSPGLKGVTDLALSIIPDVSGGPAKASLHAWRIR